ncbi:MAG: prepilin-type N-terminal cleavage/methylation domain-containing protein [Planctomycetota bacterium]
MNPDRKNAGYTLMEVLVATALVAALALAVMASYSVAFAADRTAQQLLSAQNLAQNTMETISTTAFAQLGSLDGASVTDGDLTGTISVDAISSTLTRCEVRVVHANIADIDYRVTTVLCNFE